MASISVALPLGQVMIEREWNSITPSSQILHNYYTILHSYDDLSLEKLLDSLPWIFVGSMVTVSLSYVRTQMDDHRPRVAEEFSSLFQHVVRMSRQLSILEGLVLQ